MKRKDVLSVYPSDARSKLLNWSLLSTVYQHRGATSGHFKPSNQHRPLHATRNQTAGCTYRILTTVQLTSPLSLASPLSPTQHCDETETQENRHRLNQNRH